MGLLEEAIREHLELQRRHGGDIREIARAEQEALEPLVPGQTPDWAQGPALFDHELPPRADAPFAADGSAVADPTPFVAPTADPASFVDAAPAGGLPTESQPQEPLPSQSALEQETAELDMSAVLGIAEDGGQGPYEDLPDGAVPEFGSVQARRIVPEAPTHDSGEPDFEWEIPGVSRSPGAGA
jgi:hypothetical protein